MRESRDKLSQAVFCKLQFQNYCNSPGVFSFQLEVSVAFLSGRKM